MQTSEQINDIAAALAKAQSEMAGAVKDADNPFFRSKYADLASVWDACREPLTKHGLSVVQFPRTDYTGTPEPYQWTSKQGETRNGVRVICVVSVLTRILHESGQWMEDVVSTMLPTGDPQSVGSAITYLRRYALQSAVGVAPEDDDGEAAHRGNGHEVKSSTARAAAPPKPAKYDEWRDTLTATADNGLDALAETWKRALPVFRAYFTATEKEGALDALKARAKKVEAVPA